MKSRKKLKQLEQIYTYDTHTNLHTHPNIQNETIKAFAPAPYVVDFEIFLVRFPH